MYYSALHIFVTSLLLTPVIAAAQITTLFDVRTFGMTVINALQAFFIALAVVGFLWGVVKFIKNADNETEREKGKTFMIWGIIAFLVLVSLWAIVRLVVEDSLGLGPVVPGFIDKSGNLVP